MARDVRTIRIESILGGESPLSHFAGEDQFRMSMGIDPADSSITSIGAHYSEITGLLVPATSQVIGTTFGIPYHIKQEPKAARFYIYTSAGSVYSTVDGGSTLTALTDLNDGGTSGGNGQEYYDNYMYFARTSTVARYGPLNGTATFTDDYWVSTLGLTALSNTETNSYELALHPLCRHSDGRLYIGDVVGNQGTIHYVKTTKTTVEGDTNSGSTYNALQLGYGLHPVALESYGSDLAILIQESESSAFSPVPKLAFWDTTSSNISKITWVELPQGIAVGLKNVNGALYVVLQDGLSRARVVVFSGGYSFQEVPVGVRQIKASQGVLSADGERFLLGYGSPYTLQETYLTLPCVLSLGLRGSSSGGNFTPFRGSGETTDRDTYLTEPYAVAAGLYGYVLGFEDGTGDFGTVSSSSASLPGEYTNAPSVWESRVFRIGQPFKITKIRIPFHEQLNVSTRSVVPTLCFDDLHEYSKTMTLTTINNTNFPDSYYAVIRPEGAVGKHSFSLSLKWTGSTKFVLGLPITIEYELLDD